MSIKTVLLLLFSFLLGILLSTAIPVAQVHATTDASKVTDRMEERIADKKANELTQIIERGDTMIANRLQSLQRLLERINSDKKLSSTDKTNLINDVDGTIDALTTLKAKIDADTTVDTARIDVKSIVTNFHIYVLYEPKIRLLITINNLQAASTTISTLTTKVQTLITDLKNQGKDVTAATASLDDITTQLANINSLLATDKALIGNVNFQTSNPQSIYTQVRKDLATVRADYGKIRSDFVAIKAILKPLTKQPTPTPTP